MHRKPILPVASFTLTALYPFQPLCRGAGSPAVSFWTVLKGGRLMVDNTVLDSEAAASLRPYDRQPFSWGHTGTDVHTTSLALLLHLLGDERLALNLYERFTDEVAANWPRTSFEQTIGLHAFFSRHAERL